MEKLGEHLGCDNLWVKRDDLSGELYGGNKVRKLEFTLADALARRRNPVITFGAVGSNHVLATTIYAKKLGLNTIGVFAPQPVQENLRANILCNCHQGCRIEYAASMEGALVKFARVYAREWVKNRKRPYLLWIGGSNTLGTLGYVECALELASQVAAGLMPEPQYIFPPAGRVASLAGLRRGLPRAGREPTAVGVRVSDRLFASERVAAVMANRALSFLRRQDPGMPEVRVDPGEVFMLHDYFGAGYAHYTVKGVEAMELVAELEGMKLEGTYSGKAMAGFLDFMRARARRRTVALFINTYNSRPLTPLLAECPGPEILPAEIQEYFHREVAPVGR
jgi:D-cysteine desulfhydrase